MLEGRDDSVVGGCDDSVTMSLTDNEAVYSGVYVCVCIYIHTYRQNPKLGFGFSWMPQWSSWLP